MPVGGQGDIATIRNVVSKKIENNAFITTSFDALRPQLRALTKAVCDGAEKLRRKLQFKILRNNKQTTE